MIIQNLLLIINRVLKKTMLIPARIKDTFTSIYLKYLIKSINMSACSPEIKNVLIDIANSNLEDAIGKYSSKCFDKSLNEDERQYVYEFIETKYIENIFASHKVRYLSLYYALNEKNTQINPFDFLWFEFYCGIALNDGCMPHNLLNDRIQEWKQIFAVNMVPFNSKKELMERFMNVNSDDGLFRDLSSAAPLYFLRKLSMVNIVEVKNLLSILPYLRQGDRILDYGCGAADLSIMLNKWGFKTSICDVKGGNLDAAVARFSLRNLSLDNIYAATAETPIPDIDGKYKLIIALEVLEHVRDPMSLLELFDRILDDDGIIFLGSFPFKSTSATGDHLIEAVSQRELLLKWIDCNWNRKNIGQEENIFFKKDKFHTHPKNKTLEKDVF